MTYFTTVTSKGQVTLPAPLRKKLNIKSGQRVEVSLDNHNQAVIKSIVDVEAVREANRVFAQNKGIKPIASRTQINKIMAEEAVKRYKRSLE